MQIKKLILVAPWLDPDRSKTTDFFDFKIDPDILLRATELHLLVSNDDDADIHKSVSIITNVLPNINIHNFTGMGHFTYEQMKTEKFPELLELITGSQT